MTSYSRSLLVLGMAFSLLASCTANYTKSVTVDAMQSVRILSAHHLERTQEFTLHRSSKIYLKSFGFTEQPREASTSAPPYPEKQRELEQALLRNLLTTFPLTRAGGPAASLQDAFVEAATLHAEFLFYPYFADNQVYLCNGLGMREGCDVHEDNNDEPDDFRFALVIFDVHSQRLLDTIQVYSKGHWFASENNLQVATKVAIENLSSM